MIYLSIPKIKNFEFENYQKNKKLIVNMFNNYFEKKLLYLKQLKKKIIYLHVSEKCKVLHILLFTVYVCLDCI